MTTDEGMQSEVELMEEQWEELGRIFGVKEEDETKKAEPTFEEIDDEFMKVYENAVWWGLGEEDPDLSKAPRMWRGSEHVPEFVKNLIEEALERGALWTGQYENIPSSVMDKLEEVFREKMTQPQGWSLGSLTEALQDEFGVSEDYAEVVVRNETAALANKGRELAYEQQEGSEDYEFYWSGPADHRTTPICEYAKEQTHPRHGGEPVSLDELRRILKDAMNPSINPHLDGEFAGATPERLDDWVPHHQCRHSFVRKSRL